MRRGKRRAVVRAYLDEWRLRRLKGIEPSAENVARWHRTVLEGALHGVLGARWRDRLGPGEGAALEEHALAAICAEWGLDPDELEQD